jgi:uncharacterized membrane protein YqgA involved in biofilm formation
VNGFVTATLLFCIGPLTILGAMQDATGETPQLYIIKGTLDGFMNVIFGAIYGVGADIQCFERFRRAGFTYARRIGAWTIYSMIECASNCFQLADLR